MCGLVDSIVDPLDIGGGDNNLGQIALGPVGNWAANGFEGGLDSLFETDGEGIPGFLQTGIGRLDDGVTSKIYDAAKPVGDWIGKVGQFELSNLDSMWDRARKDPWRLAVGSTTKAGTSLWNKILNRDDDPLVNDYGGATKESYVDAYNKGIDVRPGASMHQLAQTIAGSMAGQWAGGVAGQALNSGATAGSGLTAGTGAEVGIGSGLSSGGTGAGLSSTGYGLGGATSGAAGAQGAGLVSSGTFGSGLGTLGSGAAIPAAATAWTPPENPTLFDDIRSGFQKYNDYMNTNAGQALSKGASLVAPDANPILGIAKGLGQAANGQYGTGLMTGLQQLGGLYMSNKVKKAQQAQQNQINSAIAGIDQLYAPDSPYAQQLRQQLNRKDAAAGRRSQAGNREVELQARLAQAQQNGAIQKGQIYSSPAYQAIEKRRQDAGLAPVKDGLAYLQDPKVRAGLSDLWNQFGYGGSFYAS